MTTRNGSTTAGTVGSQLDERVDMIKDSVTTLVDQGKEKASQLKERAIDVKDQAMSKGNALLDSVTDQIKEHPLKSVAIAFGIGYVGMRLFR